MTLALQKFEPGIPPRRMVAGLSAANTHGSQGLKLMAVGLQRTVSCLPAVIDSTTATNVNPAATWPSSVSGQPSAATNDSSDSPHRTPAKQLSAEPTRDNRTMNQLTAEAQSVPLLELNDVARTYGDRVVLDGVSLRLHRGECVSLVGENGSGKSTLLRIAAGRDTPTEGSVLFDGHPIDEDSSEVRRRVASAMDIGAFYPDLTVREHLQLVALSHGMGDAAEAAVERVLTAHRLEAQASQVPSALSSGQTQALLLAAAFVRPHDLLILDEPEQRLDSSARRQLAELIAAHRDSGTAVLMATHHQVLNDVADHIVELGSGIMAEVDRESGR